MMANQPQVIASKQVLECLCELTNSPPNFKKPWPKRKPWRLGSDHAYIEPSHVLVAMLRQDDGPKSLLQRAGANVNGLVTAAETAMNRLPKVEGQEQVQVGRDLVSLIQAAEKDAIKRGDQYVASELFLLAMCDHKGEWGKLMRENGLSRKSLESAVNTVRGGQKVDNADSEGQREVAQKILSST